MNYTLNQLRIFKKVVETGSITKAAEELHLTQPAVSIQLKNFQDQFSLPLIDVINKKIYVTDFGKEIAQAAENILNQVHAINHKMHAHLGLLTGRLKFSVVSTGKYIAPYFISGFIKQNPGIDLIMDVTNKTQVINNLEKNEVDFSFVSVLPENIQVEKIELMPNKLFLIGNGEENFKEKEYPKSIFENLSMIYREQGSGTRYVMEKFIKRNKLPVKKKMELTGNEAVKQAVLAGLGFSIMPLIGIKSELETGKLKIVPVKGFPIKSTWYLIWLKDKMLTSTAQAYLNYLKKEKNNLIVKYFSWTDKY